MDPILSKLVKIERLVEYQSINTKEILNFKEACVFLDVSGSHLYKETCAGNVPYYKPNGKKLYFKRDELVDYVLRNRSKPQYEVETEAANLLMTKKSK